MATTQATERATKISQVHEAIKQLGLDCTYSQAKRYVQDKYGWELQEHNFYPERTILRKAKPETNMATDNRTTISPTANGEDRRPAAAEPPPTEATPDMSGVLALVQAGKLLVAKMGKEKARELIDML